jgi:hypothetical protein
MRKKIGKKKNQRDVMLGNVHNGFTRISTPSALPWVGAYFSKAMLMGRGLLAYFKVSFNICLWQQ